MSQPHTSLSAAALRPLRAEPRRRGSAADVATVAVVCSAAAERDRLAAVLVDAGFTVLQASNLDGARALIAAETVDLVLLHCAALVGAELVFCRTLAARPHSPLLLVVAGQADIVDEIVALEIGADDLLAGAVNERLVLARAKALLRRAAPRRQRDLACEAPAGWRMNPTTRAAISPTGRSVLLAPSDASAFHLFLSNPGVVFTGEAGARALGAGPVSPAAFRTTVCRLRKRLDELGEGDPILTVRGVGYAFAPAGLGADTRIPELAA